MGFLTSATGILVAILILGVLVFVHELGHFLMARVGGIGVDEFSIGMGKEIWGFTKGETRYRIGWIPFGGFCKMRGEESEDRKNKDKKKGEDDKVDEKKKVVVKKDPRAMYNRPAWARVIAILGGPVFNYLFAILVLSIMFLVGFKENPISSRITVDAPSTNGIVVPAEAVGLKDGDVIIKMEWDQKKAFKRIKHREEKIKSYVDILMVIALNKGTEIKITYLRGDTTNTATVTPIMSEERGMGSIGVSYCFLPTIGAVLSNTPAYKGGLQVEDKIVEFEGKSITYYYEFQKLMDAKKPGNTLQLLIARSNENIPIAIKLTNKDAYYSNMNKGIAYLGIAPGQTDNIEYIRKSKGFFRAFGMAFVEANTMLKKQVIDGMIAMFSGKINAQKNMSGPIRIVQITGKVVTQGDFVTLMKFMVLISIALGFFNLLPIPGLDGAHFLVNTFEMVTTIKVPDKVLTVLEYIGLGFIIVLSVLVLFNDVFNLIVGN